MSKARKITIQQKRAVNEMYLAYEINLWSHDIAADFTIGNSLFGAVKFAKNTDHDKYSYSGYDITFDDRSSFSLSMDGEFGRGLIIFGVSSFMYHNNRKKDIL